MFQDFVSALVFLEGVCCVPGTMRPKTNFVKMSHYWAFFISLEMAQKGFLSELLIVMILILRVKITVTMQEIFLLQH